MRLTTDIGLKILKSSRKILIIAVCLLLAFGSVGATGWWLGQRSAYQDIVSERCWLNKESRDIECIVFLD